MDNIIIYIIIYYNNNNNNNNNNYYYYYYYYYYYFYHKCCFRGKKKKQQGGTCSYAYYLCTNFCLFVFWLFLVKKLLCFLRIYNCVCKFDKNKNKNLFNKKN